MCVPLSAALKQAMTIKKALPYVLNVVFLITLVLLMPFAQSSSSTGRLNNGRNMAGSRPMATSIEVARFRNEGAAASVGTVQESARRVPTGADPLHHNHRPIRP